jgi:single-stranded-DNA-specific exonuclease
MVIKNLQKAADRILKAINFKERIILYGDTDLDGTTSVIILKEAISNLGGSLCTVHFPDRETEGYGITKAALNSLKKMSPALLIALDCGIGNFKEIGEAKKMGFGVIVIDHHKVLDKLPEADIIVDPKQQGDEYPFKDLAAVGIAFKLSELLLGEKMTESMRKNFLELTALATIADMMPKIEDNKFFIEEGLKNLEDSWRPGIKAFFKADFLKSYNMNEKVSKIITILNVRDVEKGFPASFRLLTSSSLQDLGVMINDFQAKNAARRKEIKETVEVIEKDVLENSEPIIFKGSSAINYILISSVASILCNSLKKPTFIFKKLKEESQGTVRVPQGIDSVSLMGKCKDYLITYGGHPLASGFRVKNENLEKFKACLIENLKY